MVMSDKPEEPPLLASSLDLVLRSLRAGERRNLSGVFGQWDEAVGPHVAANARPIRLQDRCLVVEVEEPAWATQLRFLEADLIRRLRDVAGVELDSIEVRVSRRRGAPGW